MNTKNAYKVMNALKIISRTTIEATYLASKKKMYLTTEKVTREEINLTIEDALTGDL